MGPHPAIARVRHAVRQCLDDLAPGARVLVACSGGADSMALADAVAFEAPGLGLLAGAVTVDHGLQPGSADRAAAIVRRLAERGLDPVEVATVRVDRAGGVEAAARRARYAALDEAAGKLEAAAILLGHTRDDQAETVLLGLARGSGTRSLSGMAARVGAYRRPLLDLPRAITRAACAAAGIPVWDDPHNADPAFLRARVRHRVLPVLEAELGPGVAEALARTADLCRDDADTLDQLAERAAAECAEPGDDGPTPPHATPRAFNAKALADLPAAIRRRVLRRAALTAGCPATELFAVHLRAVDALITDWRGQAGIDLPGGVRAMRAGTLLRFTTNRRGADNAGNAGMGR